MGSNRSHVIWQIGNDPSLPIESGRGLCFEQIFYLTTIQLDNPRGKLE